MLYNLNRCYYIYIRNNLHLVLWSQTISENQICLKIIHKVVVNNYQQKLLRKNIFWMLADILVIIKVLLLLWKGVFHVLDLNDLISLASVKYCCLTTWTSFMFITRIFWLFITLKQCLLLQLHFFSWNNLKYPHDLYFISFLFISRNITAKKRNTFMR